MRVFRIAQYTTSSVSLCTEIDWCDTLIEPVSRNDQYDRTGEQYAVISVLCIGFRSPMMALRIWKCNQNNQDVSGRPITLSEPDGPKRPALMTP